MCVFSLYGGGGGNRDSCLKGHPSSTVVASSSSSSIQVRVSHWDGVMLGRTDGRRDKNELIHTHTLLSVADDELNV